MNRLYQGCFILLAAALVSACIEHPHDPGFDQGEIIRPSLFLSEQIPPIHPSARIVLQANETFSREEIQFPGFSATYWRPIRTGPHPAVLLLPAIWGDDHMEKFARDLVEKGFVCLQFPSRRYLERLRQLSDPSLDDLADTLLFQVTEAGQVLHWLAEEPSVDSDRLGVLGISIGAIMAALLSETDPSVQAGAYLLGGGNLAEIMAAPQGYVKKRLRKKIMDGNGMTLEEFQASATRILASVDPLTYAGRLDSGRILMVNGRFDKVIPYKNAREYWQALGRPDWLVIPAGHYTASLFFRYIRHRVTDHFIRQL